MNILAIDTTTKNACVAVKKENEESSTMIEHNISNEITHSEKLLPLIDATLKEMDITLPEIDIYACLNGPGSFTGIRIGLATIKAFAQVQDKEIFAMSSLEAIAYTTYQHSILAETGKTAYIASLIDAKNNRVYYSLYKVCKNLSDKIIITPLLGNANAPIEKALSFIHMALKEVSDAPFIDNNDILVAGNGVMQHTNTILEELQEFSMLETNIQEIYPTTKDLIDAMECLMDTKPYMTNAYTLDAIYARLSQAERIKYEKDS